MPDNAIQSKSRQFAINVVFLVKKIRESTHEYDMTKQLIRSGTSIGANVAEAVRGQSRADFYSKLNIALKEASETAFWLDILHATHYINDKDFELSNNDCQELIRILLAITKNQKNSN